MKTVVTLILTVAFCLPIFGQQLPPLVHNQITTNTSTGSYIYDGTSQSLFLGGAGNSTTETNGSGNTAVGQTAMPVINSGSLNTAFGWGSVNTATNGVLNTGIGAQSISETLDGSYNTGLGAQSLYNNIHGSNNIAIGYKAGFNILGTNNIDIGNQGTATDTNVIRIGTLQGTTYIAGGVSTSGTNTLVVVATGATNNTTVDYMLTITAGTAMALKDSNGNQFGTPVLGDTVPLKPGQRFTGTGVTAQCYQFP